MSRPLLATTVLAGAMVVAASLAQAAPAGLDRINHVIVIYLENRSFDNMFGRFPVSGAKARAFSGRSEWRPIPRGTAPA